MPNAPLQWSTTINIAAPPSVVWALVDDVRLIPQYHPDVRQVDLLTGAPTRSVGMRYRCHVPGGRKGSCVEEVVEYEPEHRFVTTFPEDTWGLSARLSDFAVESHIEAGTDGGTRAVLKAYYQPRGVLMRLLNPLILRRIMVRRALETLAGLRRLAETREPAQP